MGLEPIDNGTIDVGETVRVGYYSQEGIQFDDQMKVIDVVQERAEVIHLSDGRQFTASQFLQYFLFSPEKQHSYVYKLSGGEKRRLYLCTVLMTNPNFLILDEPTNDLDIVTLQILEDYLLKFKGCVMVISHDRYFMDKVVDHIFVFNGQGDIRDFPGNYSDYREWKEMKERHERSQQKPVKTKPVQTSKPTEKTKLTYNERREFERLEQEIAQLEEEKIQLESDLSSGTLSVSEVTDKSKRYSELLEELDTKSMRWLELSEYA